MLLDKRLADSSVQYWQSNGAHPSFNLLVGSISQPIPGGRPSAGIRTEFTMVLMTMLLPRPSINSRG